VTPRIETVKMSQPTLNRHVGAQTKKMPMVAIESRHIDCIHGPIIVSPLDLINLKKSGSDDVSGSSDRSGKQTKATQTEFEHLKPPVKSETSVEVQTEFTSFTRTPHYYLPENHFDKYLIVDSCEDLDSQAITQKAKAFNQDFLTRFGHLFPINFIISYFHETYRQSKL